MLVTEWSFGNVLFWTMLVFFFWFMAIWIFIMIFADIFRRRRPVRLGQGRMDILIFIVPFLGAIDLPDRAAEDDGAGQGDDGAQQEAQRRVSGYSPADEVAKLAKLRDEGKITAEEYEEMKKGDDAEFDSSFDRHRGCAPDAGQTLRTCAIEKNTAIASASDSVGHVSLTVRHAELSPADAKKKMTPNMSVWVVAVRLPAWNKVALQARRTAGMMYVPAIIFGPPMNRRESREALGRTGSMSERCPIEAEHGTGA